MDATPRQPLRDPPLDTGEVLGERLRPKRTDVIDDEVVRTVDRPMDLERPRRQIKVRDAVELPEFSHRERGRHRCALLLFRISSPHQSNGGKPTSRMQSIAQVVGHRNDP